MGDHENDRRSGRGSTDFRTGAISLEHRENPGEVLCQNEERRRGGGATERHLILQQ